MNVLLITTLSFCYGLNVNDATASNVIVIGFGAETKDGILTKPIADGDIIEVNLLRYCK